MQFALGLLLSAAWIAAFGQSLGPALGQAPVISSFSQNGVLVCTNLAPGSVASVEWASSVTGPWQTNWAGLDAVTVDATGKIQVSVPMFYRVRGVVAGTNSEPLNMALIPGGNFTLGDSVDGYEVPAHTVTVSAYYLDKYEVTKALWDSVYGWGIAHGYSFTYVGSGKAANHPVQTINWYDMVKWCNARSEMEGKIPAYYTGAEQAEVYRTGQLDVDNSWVKWNAGYRLPTEAEWEKAARGGVAGQRFPWGDTISWSQANYYADPGDYFFDVNPRQGYDTAFATGATPYTSPAGSFAANGYGLYDMAGNVAEWCWDWYGGYDSIAQTDPHGPATGSVRVVRGGGWFDVALYCRTAVRSGYDPSGSTDSVGFRCVLPKSFDVPNMALIPGGNFMLGDSVDGYEVPAHTVNVSAYYMDKYEVTKALWDSVSAWGIAHGYSFTTVGSGKAANHPVQKINWYDMVKWCNARSEMEGRVPAYYTGAERTGVYRTGQLDVDNSWVNWNAGYRLPTEAEWEKAARGGVSGQRFPWGDTITWSQANYYADPGDYFFDVNPRQGYDTAFATGATPYTSPAGSFAANGYGLYDMAGNVSEWCWDWYGSYDSAAQTDPRGPATGAVRVVRGGGWFDVALYCRASVRSGYDPSGSTDYVGFRCVISQSQ